MFSRVIFDILITAFNLIILMLYPGVFVTIDIITHLGGVLNCINFTDNLMCQEG
jgi:hypothetical protein